MSRNFLLTILPLFLLCACSHTLTTQDDSIEDYEGDRYVDVLPENIKDGNIFHAFCWKYTDITKNLASIAESGFKSVQVSPVQQPKNGGPTWWSFYQPLSFSIADNSTLGTKEQLIELCTEAEKYNISVIADIVFNHLANIDDDHLEPDGTPTVSPAVEQYEPEIYQNRNAEGSEATFHHNPKATGSGAITQYYAYGKLPDLNTANPLVQQRSLDLLKECIDAGIDGFRLDAAKHIETPTDKNYASDFFPNVIGKAKEYYKELYPNRDLYVYGEILDNPDGGRTIDDYLPYIDVTDNKVKASYLSAAARKDASLLPTVNYTKGCDADHIVTWCESHDDYANGDVATQINKVWAMMMARKGGRGLYLARQASLKNIIVGEIGSYLFEETAVGAINRFHNRFLTEEEKVTGEENIYICERYSDTTDGAVVVDLKNRDYVNPTVVTFSKIKDGIYVDQLTGELIRVKNGQASINMHSSRIAVLTKSKNAPRPYLTISQRGGLFVDKLDLTLNLVDGTGTYQIGINAKVEFSDKTTVTIKKADAVDGKVKLTVEYGNEQFTYKKEYTYQTITLVEGYFNVINLNPEYIENNEIYIWSWGSSSGVWSKDYEIRNGVLLINLNTFKDTNFLLGLFAKGYVVSNVNAWDNNILKQTGDIAISAKYYDASGF